MSLHHRKDTLQNEEDEQRFQAITGNVMYLAQVTRDNIGYVVNQLARAMFEQSKARVAGAEHLLLRYLAGTPDHGVTHNQGLFQLATFSDANWGHNANDR